MPKKKTTKKTKQKQKQEEEANFIKTDFPANVGIVIKES